MSAPLDRLRHHVTGAVERGEAKPIEGYTFADLLARRMEGTMTHEIWQALSPAQRDNLRDWSGLTSQLKGYEGCRVEVVDALGVRRRFWVGRSTGWRPCHLEIARRNSSGGTPADKSYQSVILLRDDRGRRHG
jgi:hypothetical protein